MTLDEIIAREQIRHTLAAHNQAGDSNDSEGWIATFTHDAILEAPGIHLSGYEALYAWKTSHTIFAETAFRSHHVSSILINLLSAQTATARSNWLVTTDIGPDHSGRYSDRFRKTGEGWLIEHRKIEILWRASNSFLEEAQVPLSNR